MGPGHVGVLDPREVHGGTSESRQCFQDAFQIDPGLLFELFGSAEPVHFPSPVVRDPELADELAGAAAEGENANLRAVFRRLFLKHGVDAPTASSRGHATRMLESTLTANVGSRVGDSSRAAGLSASHFSRRVHTLLGLSPRDFLRQRRVLAARALIEQGKDLSDCAILAGFADQAHMTRQVRSLTGVTPGALRRNR